MKVGPKVPGPVGPAGVEGIEPDGAASGARKTKGTAGFAEALAAGRPGTVDAPGGTAGVAEVVARYGAGELTRTEALRQVAEVAVRSWPAGFADDAARARAIEEMAEVLAEDPVFSALFDKAAHGSG
jgi:hypothetical protein